MDELLTRSVVAPLDVTGDGRTLVGLICPYDTPATVDDGWGPYTEQFDRGAFDKLLRNPPRYVRVHLEHRGEWVGRGERWHDSPRGLTMEMRLDDSPAGQAACFKVRDGQTPGLSVSFAPGRSVERRGPHGPVVHRATVKAVHHVALVPEGAYPDALVSSIRHAPPRVERFDRRDHWAAWLAENT